MSSTKNHFTILWHETPPSFGRPSHWDLMLEGDSVLHTWAMYERIDLGSRMAAERLPDHRLEYLEFEGQVSGDRGTVKQWASGTWSWVIIPQLSWSAANYLFVRLVGRYKLDPPSSETVTARQLTGSLLLVKNTSLGWFATFCAD